MHKTTIAYAKTGYFSKIVCDYLEGGKALRPFYGRFPELENFKKQLEEKQRSFSQRYRDILVKSLKNQYGGTTIAAPTEKNIQSLLNKNTFTVTTGHQLNLFTGPLYFLYKIVSVINLSEQLNARYPDNHFVPVYWMATEDHDLDEINHFNFKNKKIVWERGAGGAVGALSTTGLRDVLTDVKKAFGESGQGKKLTALFENAYCGHGTLTAATRYLGNALFKKYGLVIIDGNDADLKKAFIPYAEKELTENIAFKNVTATTQSLTELGYPGQVHPREINLFYLRENLRERIVGADGKFYVNNTGTVFTKAEMITELNAHPERFSPNALLRPLYQEAVLPNLCYVGGGGELAYWFQLKGYFNAVAMPFPILLLRNSVLLVTDKISAKLKKLNVPIELLFKKQLDLETGFTHQISKIAIDFSEQRAHLKKQFGTLYELAKKTDASFLGAVAAQEKKQLNGLDRL
ncbi:MAG: bacillithiol biosynthesis cysteine-adding enzyme BshC, partial [Marinirhabdus sp.]